MLVFYRSSVAAAAIAVWLLFTGKAGLIGNVNCGLMDTGTDEEVIESVRYALKHGMPGGGYIFSTSNCIYTGMRLERYELMQKLWKAEGNYPEERITRSN